MSKKIIKVKVKRCCICKQPIMGYGNNAEPFAHGTCCDVCNLHYVIPERIKQMEQYFNKKKQGK